MDSIVSKNLENLNSKNDTTRMKAFQNILKYTDSKVDWIYEIWDGLVAKLDDENSFQRSIAIMVLCNLTKSDTENRMKAILPKLLSHTKDKKFITSRQCILNIWKIATDNEKLEEKVITHLEKRFIECEKEKHYNLLRQDIIHSIYCIYSNRKETRYLNSIKQLISFEKDNRNQRKYESIIK